MEKNRILNYLINHSITQLNAPEIKVCTLEQHPRNQHQTVSYEVSSHQKPVLKFKLK